MAPNYLAKHPHAANILFSQLLIVSFSLVWTVATNPRGIHLKFTLTVTLFQNKGEKEEECVCVCPQAVASTVLEAAAGENADY